MSLQFLILLTFLFLTKVNSFGIDNFCSFINNQDSICIKYQCGKNICSSDSNSCAHLKIWSNLMYKNTPFLNEKKVEEIFSFFSQIKECKKKDNIKLSQIVCSNKFKCDDRKNVSFFRKYFRIKPKECFCSGKFKHDCGNKMCANNKKTCDFLFINRNLTSFSEKFKKCA